MKSRAFTNGRELTLDPINVKNLDIPARTVESSLPAGLRMAWAEADLPDGRKLDVSTGAGVGGQWLICGVGDREILINLRDIVVAVVGWADELDKADAS